MLLASVILENIFVAISVVYFFVLLFKSSSKLNGFKVLRKGIFLKIVLKFCQTMGVF